MKPIRKLLCAVLAAALLTLSFAPAYAVSVDTKNASIYVSSSLTRYALTISGLSASDRVTAIRSSNPSVVQLRELLRESSESTSLMDGGGSGTYNATIYLRGLREGTSTVSFKVGGVTYQKKFTVLNYVNPIKALTVTGLGNGSLKSRFANTNSVYVPFRKTGASGSINVSAASGWRITRMRWIGEGKTTFTREYQITGGASSARIWIGKLTKGYDYELRVYLYNTRTKGSQTLYLRCS